MIFNLFSSIPMNPKSHVRGWAAHWAECLGTNFAGQNSLDCSTLYMDHGVNFGGGLNLFGGVTDKVVDRIEQLLESRANLVSLDIPMPNYVEQLSKRVGQSTCSPRLTQSVLDALDLRLKGSATLTQYDLKLNPVIIGDSHSTAFAEFRSRVIRTNGLTLHGALKNGTFFEQLGRLVDTPKRVTLACGSIDIRHHIGRQANPEAAVLDLCKNYVNSANFIVDELGIEVEVCSPVPVEYEGRKIPQTGFYKGTPFTGTLIQRQRWTQLFVDTLLDAGLTLISPPRHWYTMNPEEYAKTYMELGSSVHIAPTFYRRTGWGEL